MPTPEPTTSPTTDGQSSSWSSCISTAQEKDAMTQGKSSKVIKLFSRFYDLTTIN